MLFGSMPITVVALSALEISGGLDRGVINVVTGAAGLVYVWGSITAAFLSLVHTALTRLHTMDLKRSTLVGAVLGLGFGALTPTLFTGFFEPAAMALGVLTGVTYGFLVPRLSGAKPPGGAAS
jgi:hypothetical protein